MIKHSIRYFLNKKVRAIWDGENSKWWYSAVDIVFVITDSNNPRIYWNALKRRHPEMNAFCRQLKIYADDNKQYLSDVIDENGIRKLRFIIRSSINPEFEGWINGSLDPIDEQSKRKAYQLYKTNLINEDEVGKTISLKKIHAYLFEGLYDFAGKIRTKTISKGGFVFANGDFLPETLKQIDKKDYFGAMKDSPVSDIKIKALLKAALSDEIDNRELFMKGIDTSYYYEEIE